MQKILLFLILLTPYVAFSQSIKNPNLKISDETIIQKVIRLNVTEIGKQQNVLNYDFDKNGKIDNIYYSIRSQWEASITSLKDNGNQGINIWTEYLQDTYDDPNSGIWVYIMDFYKNGLPEIIVFHRSSEICNIDIIYWSNKNEFKLNRYELGTSNLIPHSFLVDKAKLHVSYGSQGLYDEISVTIPVDIPAKFPLAKSDFLLTNNQIPGWFIIQPNAEYSVILPSGNDLLNDYLRKRRNKAKDKSPNFQEIIDRLSMNKGEVVLVFDLIDDTYLCLDPKGRMLSFKGKESLKAGLVTDYNAIALLKESVIAYDGTEISNGSYCWVIGQNSVNNTFTVQSFGGKKHNLPANKFELIKISYYNQVLQKLSYKTVN